ncbi:uncharacterized protein [Magallana gigas]|uniref:uncharacterized protein n=1 Tax=Magallana gigas TaxID=29159 RepID=UPI00333FC07E
MQLILIIGCLVSQSSATTPITAKVTLHTSTVTWNEAHSFCQSVNQSLLTADTQERRDALLYFFHKEPWQSVKDLQFWTGLHATIPDTASTLKWASSCQQPTMAVLGLSVSSSHRYCGYISLENTREIKFGTSDCVLSKKKFLCQELRNHCLYDVIPKAFGNIVASHHLTNGSVSECQSECERFVSNNGHRCLGFNFNDVTQTCGLMTGENLYRLDKHHRPSPVHRLFIRRCEIQATLQPSGTEAHQDFSCSLRPVSPCVDVRRFCNNSHGKLETDDERCECRLQKATQTINLTEKIEKIVENIRIPPKNTSIAIRQKISVTDSRISSCGIGIVAITIMSAIFGGIVMMDLNTVRLHLTGHLNGKYPKRLRI